MRYIVLLSAAAAAAMAGGYKIPESSINGTALSAAYVAASHGADAAYYNPAAMVYNEDANLFEADMTYIGLSSIDFDGTSDYSSKKENFLVPTLHFASKKLGDNGARVGLSVIVPAGLSKRWDHSTPKATAEEFTLQTVEVNPSFAVPLSDTVSFGAGFRIIHTSGIVKSSAAVSRDMEGSAIDYGYNIALLYKPTQALNLAATYRSNIDLSVEGNAKLYSGSTLAYNGDVSVSVPVPAALNLAASYTFGHGTTVEAVFERTMWSAYDYLDFNYPVSIGGLAPYFDAPVRKNWENTNTYRLGLTQKYDKWTAMAGVAYDETPVPEATLGYELPDSDAWIVSLGGRYQLNDQWNIGLAGLVDLKQSREVHNTSINGEFSNARAYLVTAGIEYRF
ncbi:OmpP1/FadL family transporter [Sulfuricurvum sp.]|uniref:OmpP1/FadL family transporter n=1 Tax=Sulfuricurvum sp. TaxID=2025608 RepID=UPI003BB556BC